MIALLLQDSVVALLVAASAAYAAWTLMPGAWRRALAGRLLAVGVWPQGWAARLRRASQAAAGCGCDGCDHAPKKPGPASDPAGRTAAAPRPAAAVAQPITFHPRIRH